MAERARLGFLGAYIDARQRERSQRLEDTVVRCSVKDQGRAAARGPALDTRALTRFTPLSQRPARFRLFQALPSDRTAHRAEPRLPRRRAAARYRQATPARRRDK